MACTNLIVGAPAKVLTFSNLGFGNATTRFTVCNATSGTPAAIHVDYNITNATTANRIQATISYNDPTGFRTVPVDYTTSLASGTLIIDIPVYAAGSYTALTKSSGIVT